MLVNPVTSQDTTLFGLPVLHSSGAPTTDVLTASSLVATPAVANAVVKQLHLKITGAALLSQVSATPVGQSNLVSVQVTASSAKEAQSVANAFLRQVVATRSASLKAAIATILPGLESQVASLPAAERSGPGSTGAQISELRQLQLTGDPTITPSATASLPGSPSSPKTKLSLVAGLFGGLIIGIGAAFAFHALDPRLRRESQLREIFDVPTMARIPREHSGQGGTPDPAERHVDGGAGGLPNTQNDPHQPLRRRVAVVPDHRVPPRRRARPPRRSPSPSRCRRRAPE